MLYFYGLITETFRKSFFDDENIEKMDSFLSVERYLNQKKVDLYGPDKYFVINDHMRLLEELLAKL